MVANKQRFNFYSKKIAVIITGGILAASMGLPVPVINASETPAVEFAFVVKTENQIQFGVCTNIPGPFQGPIDLTLSVKDSENLVIKDSGWDWRMIPETIWNGVPGACRAFDAAMQNVWPAWNSVSGLSPGTTYTFEAELTLKPLGGPEVVHRASQQVTTGGGCPVGAPDDSLLRKSTWNGIGIDADNKAVLTGLSVNIDAIPPWASDIYPLIVQWVPEYLWTGKTMAREGYFWDPVTENFGPPLPVGEIEDQSDLLEFVHLSACDTDEFVTEIIVDPFSESICEVDVGGVRATAEGACVVTLNVSLALSSQSLSLSTNLISRNAAAASLSVETLLVVRPGGGSGSGGGGGSGVGDSVSPPGSAGVSVAPSTPTVLVEGSGTVPVVAPNTQSSQVQAQINQIANLTPTAMQKLSPSALSALAPQVFAVMSPAQVRALNPFQIRQLSAKQMAALSPAALRAMKPKTFRALSVGAFRGLTLQQIRQLRPSQISALGPVKRSIVRNIR